MHYWPRARLPTTSSSSSGSSTSTPTGPPRLWKSTSWTCPRARGRVSPLPPLTASLNGHTHTGSVRSVSCSFGLIIEQLSIFLISNFYTFSFLHFGLLLREELSLTQQPVLSTSPSVAIGPGTRTPAVAPDELDLEWLRGTGKRPGEEALPETSAAAATQAAQPNGRSRKVSGSFIVLKARSQTRSPKFIDSAWTLRFRSVFVQRLRSMMRTYAPHVIGPSPSRRLPFRLPELALHWR